MNFRKLGLCFFLACIPYLSLCANEKQIPQLAVTGRALLKRPADEATLTLGVSSEAPTANEALLDNSTKMRKLIDALKEAGLKKGDYETGQFSLNALYTNRPPHAPEDWTPKVRGYRVDNRLIARTQQLDIVGNWIDAAVQNGGNAVDDISFGLHDFRAYRTEAIREASSYAKADAATLAEGLGIRLGKVLTVTLEDASYQPLAKRAEFARAYTASSAAPPIEAGDVDVQARVTVVYEILE